MNKTFKKTLSVALCIAFSGLQMSLADVLTGGTFAGRDVLNGTGAQIKGHTAGLTGLTTNGMDATLVFGANTRIDWSKLNVDRGQTLYFNNGNYGVLNNVVGGSMSKFAGSIKADNGKIVISNPNGILFQGGKFESLGGLVLTAAKYQDMNIDENTNFNSLDFSRSASGTVSQFGNIDITNRSVLKAGDIEVHGFGVNVENSQLTADNNVLVTADGMHYIAYERPNLQTQEELHWAELDNKILMTDELREKLSDKQFPAAQHIDPSHVVTDDHKIINKIDFDQLQKPLEVHPGLNIAGSAITASDGTITLVSSTTANIKNSTFNGNTSVASTNAEKGLINIDNSKFYGDLSASTSGLEGVVSNISKSEVSGDLDVDGNLYLTKSTVNGDLIVSDTQVGASYQAGNETANSGYGVKVSGSTIGGGVDINSVDNVYLSGSEVSGHSDIYSAKDVNLTSMVMGSADIEAGNRVGLFSQGKGITFNGNVNLEGNTIQLGETGVDYIPVGAMGDNAITVNGALTANAESTIGYTATVTADRINMTSQNSSIVQGNANNFQGKLVADTINLTARKGGVMALDASKGGSGEYAEAMKGNYNPTGSARDYQEATLATRTEGAQLNYSVRSDLASIHSEAAQTVVTGSGRTVNVSADGKLLAKNMNVAEDASFKSDETLVAGVTTGTDLNVDVYNQNALTSVIDSNVGGDMNSEGRLSMHDVNVAGKFTNHNEYDGKGHAVLIQRSTIGNGVDIDSGAGLISIYNMNIEGDSNVVSKGDVSISEVNMGNTNVDTTGYVTILSNRPEGNTFDGDLNVSGEYVSFGGFYDNNQTLSGYANTVVNGDLNVKADQTIGYSGTVTANSMNFESANSSIVQANKDGVTSQLIADEITFTAPNGVAAALDANGSGSEYYVAMHEGYTASADRGAESYDALNTTTRTEDGNLRLNVGAAVSNINADADKTFVTNNGKNDIQDIKVVASGDLEVKGLTVVRNENDTASKAKTGNAVFEAANGTLRLDKITADSNIEGRSHGALIAESLKADSELNGYGRVYLNSDTELRAGDIQADHIMLYSKGDILTNHLVSTGTTENWGINAVSQGDINISDVVSNRGISSYCCGSLVAEGLTADADHNNSGVVYLSGNGLYAKDITGPRINLANDQLEGGDIELTNIVATSTDDNAWIHINADGGSVTMTDSSSTGDIIVTGTPWSHDTQYVNVKLKDVYADEDRNGQGELIVNTTGNVDMNHSTGSNIKITADGDVDAYDSRAYRNDLDDTKGNINITAGGEVMVGELLADTDIRVETENTIEVNGTLMADRDVNGVGDLYLHGGNLSGLNGANLGETGAMYGANITLIQDNQTDTLNISNLTAGLVNDGNILIDAPTDNLVLTDVKATGDVTVDNRSEDGYLDSAVLNNVFADSEGNGIGDLNIRTRGDLTATNVSGANVTLETIGGNIEADGVTATRGDQSDESGNVRVTTQDGNIAIGNVTADTDIVGVAENGGSIVVTGDLTADAEGNGVGDVILTAGDQITGNNANLGETGAISGANVTLTQERYEETFVASNVTATGNDGNVTFNVPTDNVDLSGIHATGDVTVNNGNEGNVLDSATLYDVYADSDRNKVGDLNIVTNGDINATSVGGANVNLESLEGNVTVDGGFATDDLVVTAKEGEANVTDAHADLDNDGVGDLVITGKDVTGDDLTGINIIVNADEDANLKDVITNGQGGHDIEITAGNDVNAENVVATDNVVITAGNDVTGENLVADENKDGIGDLIINAGNNADVTGGEGENVKIDADNNVTAKDVTGADDVVITAGNDVTGENLVADGDKDGVGDLIINAGNNADVTGGSGENVNIEADKDVTAKDVTGADDVVITAGNDVTGENLVADGDKDGVGDLIINAGNNADVTGGEGENVNIEADKDVTAKDVTGADDVIITAGENVTGENLVADGDEDGIGDLIINAGKDVDIDGGEGSNIYIETKEGSVDADNLVADGDDSIGNGKIVIIAPNGDVDVNGADANGDVDVTIGNGDLNLNDVTPDADGNGVGELIVTRLGADDESLIDNSIADEVVKNLNNLEQVGVDTSSQAFTPIAFAADDDDDEASLAKRIAKIVFKTPSTGIVTITDKLSTLR